MDCTPSLTKSKMVLDSEITEGQSATMAIQAFDDEGFKIKQARGRFFEVLVQMPGGNELTKQSQFKDGEFVVSFDHDHLGSVGQYSISVSGWNDGRSSQTHKYKVLANASDTLALPTKQSPHILEVKSSKVKKIVAGGLAVVIGVSLGTAFVYARRNPGITKNSALQSNNGSVFVPTGLRAKFG